MREILFRGKRVDTGEWVEGMLAYFFDNPNNAMIMPRCYFGTRDFGGEDEKGNPIIEDEMAMGGFINVIPSTVGQFTGLTDKNGDKIFEGDELNGSPVEYITKLSWDSGGSIHPGFYCRKWLESDEEEYSDMSYHCGFDNCEITGNIHDK
jgi:hypothetical protein